jgi:predicted exporter
MDSKRRGVRDVALIVMSVIVGLAVFAIASPFVFLLYLFSFVLFGDLSIAHTVLLAPLKARCC